MTRPSLDRVLRAANSDSAVEAWSAAASVVSDERAAVERLLAADAAPSIYGFTTLLGHLDGVPQTQDDADTLLKAHLIGSGYEASGTVLRLVAACKAEQLHHGGSGVHPASFAAVIDAARTPGPDATGAWDASYGSGDVVPAAWWVASLRDRALVDLSRRGDLIALINGTFFSTAAAIIAGAAVARSGARVLASAARVARRGAQAASARQLPISSRDLAPVTDALVSALSTLGDALEHRLGRASANPLFELGADGELAARSQNGFLDYPATFALTGLTQATLLAASVTQRLIATSAAERSSEGAPDPRFVQQPKVAQAIVESLLLDTGALPSRFAGAESEGIEDLRDLSLTTALRARRVVDRLDELAALLETVEPGEAVDPNADSELRAFEATLAQAFVGGSAVGALAVDGSVLDALRFVATLRLDRLTA